jgi:hypothetical protein
VCHPKDQGGLRILNSKFFNIALMVKWIWKLFWVDFKDTLRARLIKSKYVGAEDIFSPNPSGGSQFWRSLHKIKHFFKFGACFNTMALELDSGKIGG